MASIGNKGTGPQDHASIGKAAELPGVATGQFISVAPVILPSPNRPVDLILRVTAPTAGTNLPILLFSHGQGRSNWLSSMNGYAPLIQYYASQGFAVLQPTHLTSGSLVLDEVKPNKSIFWRSRVDDMKHILDHLDDLEAAVPYIKGRLDRARVAIVGHSMGGQTAGMLLGQRLIDESGVEVNVLEPRIKAGVLLTIPGSGGDALGPFARENLPFMLHPNFEHMTTQALVVAGDKDVNPQLSAKGSAWHRDPYKLSPGPKDLLALSEGKHILGGISGWDTNETASEEGESPELVAVTQRMTLAYLKSKLYEGDKSWEEACKAFEQVGSWGMIERK